VSARRTQRDATIAERLLPRIRVIDAVHPLFGQPLEVSPSGLIRRIGWIRVVLPDGRHRWVPQKATNLNVSACEARPNRDLPLVSVRTLIPLRWGTGVAMRGDDEICGSFFSYIDLEERVRSDHPLRVIRQIANTALKSLSAKFAKPYSPIGRGSIPPERLMRAMLLSQDKVKGLLSSDHFSVDGTLLEVWASPKSFRPKDGSGEPPGPGRNGGRDFHGERRRNDTHASHRGEELARQLAVQQPVAVLVKVVASHTASSMPSPTNQRNNRSLSIRSTNCRSERI